VVALVRGTATGSLGSGKVLMGLCFGKRRSGCLIVRKRELGPRHQLLLSNGEAMVNLFQAAQGRWAIRVPRGMGANACTQRCKWAG
jgi:hypothetical protein